MILKSMNVNYKTPVKFSAKITAAEKNQPINLLIYLLVSSALSFNFSCLINIGY